MSDSSAASSPNSRPPSQSLGSNTLPLRVLEALPWSAAALSGALSALAFAPWNYASLIWISQLPLLWSLWNLPATAPKWKAPALGYLSGIVFFTTTFSWLASLAALFQDPALYGLPLLLALYLALYPAIWAWLIQRPPEKPTSHVGHSFRNIAFALRGAAAWVLLDWIRGWLFTGFGWNPPGVALHQNLVLIQIADLLGVHGISFVILFANLAFALASRRVAQERTVRAIPAVRIELMAVLLIVCACITYGARTLIRFRPGTIRLTALCVQPNQPQNILFDPAVEQTVFDTLDRLMNLSQKLAPPPDLILWPEAATPRGIFADDVNHEFFVNQSKRSLSPLLIGSIEPDSVGDSNDLRIFNSAILVTNQGNTLQSYRKRHLVPFGEFLPFRNWMPDAVRNLVPGDLDSGTEANLLSLERPSVQIGALVCFEDSLSRETRVLAQKGANLLINLTNDAWFATSSAAAQHLANAQFRAIETRLPLLRCANTGVTCLVDPVGRVTQEIPPFTEGLATHPVLLSEKPSLTPYVLLGERWISLCALASLSLALGNRRKA